MECFNYFIIFFVVVQELWDNHLYIQKSLFSTLWLLLMLMRRRLIYSALPHFISHTFYKKNIWKFTNGIDGMLVPMQIVPCAFEYFSQLRCGGNKNQHTQRIFPHISGRTIHNYIRKSCVIPSRSDFTLNLHILILSAKTWLELANERRNERWANIFFFVHSHRQTGVANLTWNCNF